LQWAPHHVDHCIIAYVEMATALKGLIWYMTEELQEPIRVMLHTDSYFETDGIVATTVH
jgi:hypothetical protein